MPTVLQNVVFPTINDPDVLPLYADPESWSEIEGKPVRLTAVASIDNVLSRHSTRVRQGRRVSYATYFNAFPAAYWQRWTVVTEVTLNLTTSGPGTIIVYRSNATGAPQQVTATPVSGDAVATSFTLPLNKFGDGGWYWFDLIAGDGDLVLERGSWTTDASPTTPGKLNIGMTTYNKPDYCVRTLQAITESPDLVEAIDQIFLVDQGTQLVSDEDATPALQDALGEKLRIITQPNLGGSGGFSRSMAETLQRDESDFLLLLDDDIEFEPESALRAHQFGRFSRTPIIVGGHMFDLHDKPVIHAWAETVGAEAFNWGPSFPEQHRHNFRNANLRQTPWMHARLDADYNGWWMCLIPKQVIADIGLSIPVFIKWDDAEYGLRARKAGYRTVSLPGVALWHVSWLDKDDSQDWGAYFHTRNRIIAGLLHSDRKGSGRLLQNSGRQDIKKLLNMQYYATQLAVDALRDVLKGPEVLHEVMPHSMPDARKKAADFPETRVYLPGDADAPVARGGRVIPNLDPHVTGPYGVRLALFTAKLVPLHWRRTVSEADAVEPELEYPKREAFWWRIPYHRSVIVGTADGAGKMWYRHDRAKFRRLLRESRELTREIEKNWESLAEQYRAAMPRLTSVEEWEKTFNGR